MITSRSGPISTYLSSLFDDLGEAEHVQQLVPITNQLLRRTAHPLQLHPEQLILRAQPQQLLRISVLRMDLVPQGLHLSLKVALFHNQPPARRLILSLRSSKPHLPLSNIHYNRFEPRPTRTSRSSPHASVFQDRATWAHRAGFFG